jgi:hypothetical protein
MSDNPIGPFRVARGNYMRTLLALILLTAPALAQEPVIPDEATKLRALMLGYTVNGNSMVREPSKGSIDVRELLELTEPKIAVKPSPFGPLPKVKAQ